MYKDEFNAKQSTENRNTIYRSFEFLEISLQSSSHSLLIVVFYRPGSSNGNKLSPEFFCEEFCNLLEHYTTDLSKLLIVGDFNFHVDDKGNKSASDFLELLEIFNLTQHVSVPTHRAGHTLDLLITRDDENILDNVCAHDPMISDHFVVSCNLRLNKPRFPRKEIEFRKLKQLDMNQFRNDIAASSLITNPPEDLAELVLQYDSVLSSILDKHAPIRKQVVTVRPAAPWYTERISDEKRKRRKLERRWRASSLDSDYQIYQQQCALVKELFYQLKSDYYSNLISENQFDLRKLFTVIGKLLHRNNSQIFPRHVSSNTLADAFMHFFDNKIRKIRAGMLAQFDTGTPSFTTDVPINCDCELNSFSSATSNNLMTLISAMSFKSSELDPIPGHLLKECTDTVLPTITKVVNQSLATASFPHQLKEAMIKPLIKKSNLDTDEFKNFRPISNPRFLSKIVEKVVAVQLIEYLEVNGLNERFQSAYKKFHSTETALLRVHNDINIAIDSQNSVILLLLDFSAAFDTVDHTILLKRLSSRFNINGKALEWFQSYLSDRTQFVRVDGLNSEHHRLDFGVPQGSVLGPLLYTLYTSPLADITRKHNMNYHFYADDSQLYVTFKTSSQMDMISNQSALLACVNEMDSWMVANKLKRNCDKLELIIFSSPYKERPDLTSLTIREEVINTSCKVRNIGVVFDESLSMAPQFAQLCKSSFYHLRKIARIRSYLTPETAKLLLHAFVTSKLDYCNSLLYGVPKYQILRLQRIQNVAARLVTATSRYDHISPVLKQLHWLPVAQRIKFKILLLTYKALKDCAPSYIKDLLQPYVPTRCLRSASHNLLKKPRYNLQSFGARAFSVAAPTLWNSLPLELRNVDSINVFKSKLKALLFREAFGT